MSAHTLGMLHPMCQTCGWRKGGADSIAKSKVAFELATADVT